MVFDYHLTREDKERIAKSFMIYKEMLNVELVFSRDDDRSEYLKTEFYEIDELAHHLDLGGYNNDYYTYEIMHEM